MSREAVIRFSFILYCKDHLPSFMVALPTLTCVAFVLRVLGLNAQAVAMVCCLVAAGMAVIFLWDYLRKRSSYNQLLEVARDLEQVRHLTAFASEPSFLEGRVAWRALEALSKTAGDEAARINEDAAAYQRYVELWVHEIKTPITACKLILSRMKGPDATALRQEVERIELKVEQALYYVRQQAFSSDYAIRRISLAKVARESCKRNQNMLISSGVRPVFELGEACAFADAQWLGFVVDQLVSNAVKYGATEVVFRSFAHNEASQHMVQFEIADNGKGISAADLPKIFERGFVGENGRANGSATGMGLYLCANICKLMGLSIEVFSQVGKGSRFVITLPVA